MSERLPQDIHDALLKSAKGWLLNNFVGGHVRLDAWSDHYACLISIYSSSLPGDRAANLRRLARLAKDGQLVEKKRYREGIGTRVFTANRPALDQIGAQAIKEHEVDGYVVGVMTDRKKPQ